MIVSDSSLAALLLTNRIVDVGVKPLSSREFWSMCRAVGDPAELVGMPTETMAVRAGVTETDAERCVELLAAGTAFAFERERLEEEGVRLVSALDQAFPQRLRDHLGDNCPAAILVAGRVEYLNLPAIGVVGSRDASPEALEVAADAARLAAAHGRAVVSGLARGIDQAAMMAALDAGGAVVGVPAEGLRIAARNAEVRSRVHSGELCMASPYAPSMRFTAGNAMGRNKVVYGLAEVTLVVCSDDGSGGTWEGAREGLRREFGRVAVWLGEGAGPGNAKLIESGGTPIGAVEELLHLDTAAVAVPAANQPSLFE